ncbi:MAG: DnaJ domain-containing protein [Eubacteriales bacterium]|nr:DnaJ domain-containing protein [Eubacteriales bacterium]
MSSLYDKKPFEVLGISPSAEAAQVRAAYRKRVKACHPDQYQDPEKQHTAQEMLIELNLAYEEALKLCSQRHVGFNLVSQEEAKHFAARLVEQGNLESALRQLNRADSKDAEWYYLQGNILMGMRQYQTAHQSYREAVRRDPDNNRFRTGALNAAIAVKKNKQLLFRMRTWVEDIFKPNKK